jgi:hypothetical protein
MTRAACQVHQASFGEQNDPLAVREDDVVHLGLDVFPLMAAQLRHLDLVVEVADVADDGLMLHALHVRVGDHACAP